MRKNQFALLVDCFRLFDGRDEQAVERAVRTLCDKMGWRNRLTAVNVLLATDELSEFCLTLTNPSITPEDLQTLLAAIEAERKAKNGVQELRTKLGVTLF
jgi:hypothetical protein